MKLLFSFLQHPYIIETYFVTFDRACKYYSKLALERMELFEFQFYKNYTNDRLLFSKYINNVKYFKLLDTFCRIIAILSVLVTFLLNI